MKTVLLIDDKEDIREILTDFLEDSGHQTEACENGKEAIGKLEHKTYDLIITDLLMPEQDGFTFLKNQKALPSQKDVYTPVIVMTGGSPALDFQNDVDKLASDGCSILKKPFTKDQFMAAVDKALSA